MARGNISKIAMKSKTPKKSTKKLAAMGRRSTGIGNVGGGGKAAR